MAVKHKRPMRPQMRSLLSLKSFLPDPSQGTFTSHFRHRMEERGFDLDVLEACWRGDAWSPTNDDRWLVGEPDSVSMRRWSVVVEFAPDDTPVFITVCDRIDWTSWEAA